VRAIVALTIAVTERPWSLTSRDLEAPRAAGLDDASILHVVLQAANFGHLNRIADAVGVAADYPDRFGAPHVEPATPAYLLPFDPPPPDAGDIHLGLRPGIDEVYAAWRGHALDRDTPSLDRRRRSVIARAVADRVGDLRELPGDPIDDLDHALIELADVVTLAPWKLGPEAYARVRAWFPDDAQVFDAVATASSCTAFSRIAVALAGFAR
jgi:alkylhydroperoxidase family enzyme